jgi:aryl-alcohol dehydrogenase-like predicted oxidoreductase
MRLTLVFACSANTYQGEESEIWLGEWMSERKNRDQMVVATKYTTSWPADGPKKVMANYQGQHAKSLHLSVEASLKKLQTTYIDLVSLHPSTLLPSHVLTAPEALCPLVGLYDVNSRGHAIFEPSGCSRKGPVSRN